MKISKFMPLASLFLLFSSIFIGSGASELPGGSNKNVPGTSVSTEVRQGGNVYSASWLDVRNFGADPTGVKDSTSAIQAAIDASIGGDGAMNRPVYIPTGVYRITAPIDLYDGRRSRYVRRRDPFR